MDAKLTLKLNSGVIQRAKLYAKEQDVSLSKLIENYLSALTSSQIRKVEVSPLVDSLAGVIDLNEFSDKEKYADYLSKKYT